MTCIRIGSVKRRAGSGIVCTTDSPLVVSDPDCPNAADHTPHPAGYLAHQMWADEMMAAGREQTLCPGGCGKYAVWTGPPLPAGAVADG